MFNCHKCDINANIHKKHKNIPFISKGSGVATYFVKVRDCGEVCLVWEGRKKEGGGGGGGKRGGVKTMKS